MNATLMFSIDLTAEHTYDTVEALCAEHVLDHSTSLFVVIEAKDAERADVWRVTYTRASFQPNAGTMHVCAGAASLCDLLAAMAVQS